MKIITEDDYAGTLQNHPWGDKFTLLSYKDGGASFIPKGFFRTWLDEEPNFGSFYIGKCSGIGVGSLVKYDLEAQKLVVGRYVSGGLRLRFLLNGQHEHKTMSTAMLSLYGLSNAPMPQYGDTIVKNDVWLGDEAMVLGGSTIENGCIIGARALLPPNFSSEPYGIYVGAPAKLKKFRFSEKIRERLIDLAWWRMPFAWIGENNASFLVDLNEDEGRALETLAELKRRKAACLDQPGIAITEQPF